MNEMFWLIWVSGIVDSLRVFFAALSFVILVCCSMYLFTNLMEEGEAPFKKLKAPVCIAVALLFLSSLIPNQKTFVAMIGGYALQETVQNDEVKRTGGKALDALNAWLDSVAKEGSDK